VINFASIGAVNGKQVRHPTPYLRKVTPAINFNQTYCKHYKAINWCTYSCFYLNLYANKNSDKENDDAYNHSLQPDTVFYKSTSDGSPPQTTCNKQIFRKLAMAKI